MWSTQTAWFDVAIVMGIFAIGNILFGHFEEHKPKALRVVKLVLVAGMTVLLSCAGLRWVAYTLIGALAVAAAYIHIWWLPSHGINGWTGEPKARYYELLGLRPRCREETTIGVPELSERSGSDPMAIPGGHNQHGE